MSNYTAVELLSNRAPPPPPPPHQFSALSLIVWRIYCDRAIFIFQSSSSWLCCCSSLACTASMCTRTSRRAATSPTSPRTWSLPAAPGRWPTPCGERRRTSRKLTRSSGVTRITGPMGQWVGFDWGGGVGQRELAPTRTRVTYVHFSNFIFLFFSVFHSPVDWNLMPGALYVFFGQF